MSEVTNNESAKIQELIDSSAKFLAELIAKDENCNMTEENRFVVGIKYEDDGKGKWQSVSARIEVDGDDYFFPGIAGFGETEKEAKEDLRNNTIPLLAQVSKLFSEKKEIEAVKFEAIPIVAKIKVGDKLFDTQEKMFDYFINIEKENKQLREICDYNCPVHKLATHNTCLTCSAVRNSPYHDLKDVSEEELQEIKNEAEKEAKM